MDDENKEIIIAGDFNRDLLKKDCVNVILVLKRRKT